ncbi:FG-GAP repeat domain-containing protein [Pirellulimonas nuda]|nr:VCBS repeat-containing protein [Pirellulimonas nuda]
MPTEATRRVWTVRPLIPALGCAACLLGAGLSLAIDAADHQALTPVRFDKLLVSDRFFCEGATCADVDNDGQPDFIAGPFWFSGPGFDRPHRYRAGEPYEPKGYSDNFFTFAHDFNADGWVDVLVVPAPGEDASWFENPKGEDRLWRQRLAFAAVDNESPALVDVTGDGAPELICIAGGRFGYAAPPERPTDEAWPFHAVSPDLGYTRYTHGLGAGDVNGDGRADLLEKNGWWEQPAGAAAEALWRFHPVAFSEAGGAQMFAVDLDGDGDNDVVTSKNAHAYGLAWFENHREGDEHTFHEHPIIPERPAADPAELSVSQLHALGVADINGDGVPDLVTGKRYWAHSGRDPGADEPAVLMWLETVRDASGVRFTPHLIDKNSGVGTQVEVKDINSDGLFDVIVGNKKGLFVFRQAAPTP